MKVPIKFRGKNIETGKMAYGYLVIYEKHQYTHWLITPGLEANEPVEPGSVAQLVGYDKNGAEVYTGDVLTLEDGKQVSPEWEIVFRDKKGESYYAREEILKW